MQFKTEVYQQCQLQNKVNTKVDMRIVLDNVAWLEEDAKDALKRRVGKQYMFS